MMNISQSYDRPRHEDPPKITGHARKASIMEAASWLLWRSCTFVQSTNLLCLEEHQVERKHVEDDALSK